MNLFSENTNTIAQHGRRGANMQTLRIDHPDIEKFIGIKTGDIDMVKYSNISVLLTHDFMQAVKDNKDFELKYDNEVYKTVKARDLWNEIINHAHASAEPGLLFWDTMKDYHNAEYCSPLVSTNPCAEQPLPDGGCCNLGAVNLERFVDDNGNFMIDQFKETVAIGTRFLDNVIDYNLDRHALESQKQNAFNDRRIGLGILGLGDMLVRMNIKYDSEDALQTIDQVMKIFCDTAYETSSDLAKEKGLDKLPIEFFENLSAPNDYTLGPGDEIVIVLWGETQLRNNSKCGPTKKQKDGLWQASARVEQRATTIYDEGFAQGRRGQWPCCG